MWLVASSLSSVINPIPARLEFYPLAFRSSRSKESAIFNALRSVRVTNPASERLYVDLSSVSSKPSSMKLSSLTWDLQGLRQKGSAVSD